MTTGEYSTVTPPSQTIRSVWLEALLPLVPEMGWSEAAACRAADQAAISENARALAAPNGVSDLRHAFFQRAETETRAALDMQDMTGLKTHQRVAKGVRQWLDSLSPHREAVRRALPLAGLPGRARNSVEGLWSLADMIWLAAGDTSDDYNRYTKRGLLVAALLPILIYWQSEPDDDALDAFIMRRLKDVMQAGQAGGRVVAPLLRAFTARPARDA